MIRVFLFEPRFRDLVSSGAKCQTVRIGRRGAAAGELLGLRGWTGTPYRSPQYDLIPPTPCLSSEPVRAEILGMRSAALWVGDALLSTRETRDFVLADGFGSIADFAGHWMNLGVLKFDGRLIKWAPPALPVVHDARLGG